MRNAKYTPINIENIVNVIITVYHTFENTEPLLYFNNGTNVA